MRLKCKVSYVTITIVIMLQKPKSSSLTSQIRDRGTSGAIKEFKESTRVESMYHEAKRVVIPREEHNG